MTTTTFKKIFMQNECLALILSSCLADSQPNTVLENELGIDLEMMCNYD